MKSNKRFLYWRVFWVTLALYIGLIGLGMVATSMSPEANDHYNWKRLLSPANIAYQVGSFLLITLYYYVTLNGFYRRFAERRPLLDFIRYSVVVVIILAVYYALSYHLSPEKARQALPVAILIFSYTVATVFYLGLPLLFSYLVFLRDERKQRKVLEEQKLQLEKERTEANYNFLKAQINPHFLHNALNFLYAKALPLSDELSEGILTLSDIMRYALSEGNARDGKAPLKDEIEHVRNVIKINQLRYSNKLNVIFDMEGVVNGAQIIPFVLITLVENAFKHGDFKSETHPITIRIRISGGELFFSCVNKKKTGPKELSTGIGLENIRTRLDLAYGKKYSFVVREDADLYTTELTLRQL